ncbi:MAG: HAD family hydrolase [Propionibacteriaceae bacterium]|nr:HAD family hydrolase [Propionibacteriaceae bacterium]
MGWRHLVWDMGGTMIDTYPAVDRTLHQVCRRHGCEVDEQEVTRLTRVSIAEAGEELARRCQIAPRHFVEAYAGLKQSWKTDPPPVMAGARELMAYATERRGLNLVVTHRDRESAQDLLRAHDLIVDDMICAPDGYPRKPDPTMHRLVVERNGLDPAECLAVGDRAIDCEAARAAGLQWVLLVTPGLPLPTTGALSRRDGVLEPGRTPTNGNVIHALTELW